MSYGLWKELGSTGDDLDDTEWKNNIKRALRKLIYVVAHKWNSESRSESRSDLESRSGELAQSIRLLERLRENFKPSTEWDEELEGFAGMRKLMQLISISTVACKLMVVISGDSRNYFQNLSSLLLPLCTTAHLCEHLLTLNASPSLTKKIKVKALEPEGQKFELKHSGCFWGSGRDISVTTPRGVKKDEWFVHAIALEEYYPNHPGEAMCMRLSEWFSESVIVPLSPELKKLRQDDYAGFLANVHLRAFWAAFGATHLIYGILASAGHKHLRRTTGQSWVHGLGMFALSVVFGSVCLGWLMGTLRTQLRLKFVDRDVRKSRQGTYIGHILLVTVLQTGVLLQGILCFGIYAEKFQALNAVLLQCFGTSLSFGYMLRLILNDACGTHPPPRRDVRDPRISSLRRAAGVSFSRILRCDFSRLEMAAFFATSFFVMFGFVAFILVSELEREEAVEEGSQLARDTFLALASATTSRVGSAVGQLSAAVQTVGAAVASLTAANGTTVANSSAATPTIASDAFSTGLADVSDGLSDYAAGNDAELFEFLATMIPCDKFGTILRKVASVAQPAEYHCVAGSIGAVYSVVMYVAVFLTGALLKHTRFIAQQEEREKQEWAEQILKKKFIRIRKVLKSKKQDKLHAYWKRGKTENDLKRDLEGGKVKLLSPPVSPEPTGANAQSPAPTSAPSSHGTQVTILVDAESAKLEAKLKELSSTQDELRLKIADLESELLWTRQRRESAEDAARRGGDQGNSAAAYPFCS